MIAAARTRVFCALVVLAAVAGAEHLPWQDYHASRLFEQSLAHRVSMFGGQGLTLGPHVVSIAHYLSQMRQVRRALITEYDILRSVNDLCSFASFSVFPTSG